MAENKKSFIIYTSWKRWLDGLNLEQKGMWLDWMLSYTNDENPLFPKDQAVMIACMMAQDTLKRDLKKYEDRKARLMKNGKQYQTKIDNVNTEVIPISERNRTEVGGVNVNDNVNVNVNDNVLSNDNVNNISVINNTCSKSDLNGGVNEDKFNRFWSEYPRKVGKDKCQKWFKAHKVTDELLNKMLDTISKFKQSKGWLKDNGQYIPHPYTWLNRGGWNDELEQEKNTNPYSNCNIETVWEEL